MILAIVLIAVALIWLALAVRHEIRATRPAVDDQDWIARHAGWLDQHEVEREFWAIVHNQQEVP